ncbi:MAG: hypothetical protein R2758_02805 [Bacteroidales bacterium]
MIKIYSIFLAVLLLASCARQQTPAYRSQGPVDFPLTADDEAMLDSIQHRTFMFFYRGASP